MAIVKISDLPLVDSPVEGTDLFVVVQDNVTKKAYASDIQTYVGFEEVQYATAGQTVFNLTTMTYAAGANNLMVFVDGVNQYEGLSYTETDNNTVTFTQGLHVGAVVKFSTVQTQTSLVNSAGAVTFTAAGAGAVPRSVQSKERDIVSVKDFGAVGDGVNDDTQAFKNAIQAAKGGYVFVPIGEYRITSPLDQGTTEEIRLIGPVSAFFSHDFYDFATYAYTNNFTPQCIQDPAGLKTKFATLACDGTNLIGSPDGGTVGTKSVLKHLANFCVYGYNGAEIGLYFSPLDALVENCNFALFEKFGICIRGGITSTFRKISFVDNGWNLNESGSASYPADYVSGCAFNVVSNFIPNDFATSVGPNATTTMSFENFYINVRAWTGINQSGYRGIQVHLARGLNLDDIGSYTGHYFYLTQGSGNNIYVEDYAFNGLAAGDGTPHGIYSYYSALTLNSPVVTMNAVPAQEPIYISDESQVWSPTSVVLNDGKTNLTRAGSVTSRWNNEIEVTTPGGTDTYSLNNHAMPAAKGFCGFLIISLFKKSDLADTAHACYFVQKFNAGVSGPQIPTATQISVYDSGAGNFTKVISNVNFNSSGGIEFDVAWGSGFSASEDFYVNFGLVGLDTVSSAV